MSNHSTPTTYPTPAAALHAADNSWSATVAPKVATKATRVAVCANGDRVAYDMWAKVSGRLQKVGAIAVVRSTDGSWVIA